MFTRILLGCFLLLFASASQAVVYSWKIKGQTFYGDSCPAGVKCTVRAGSTSTTTSGTTSTTTSGTTSPTTTTTSGTTSTTTSGTTSTAALWTAGMDGGNMQEWYLNGQGTEYNGRAGCKGDWVYIPCPTASDGSSSSSSAERARSGTRSVKLSVPGTGAVRLARGYESVANKDLVYTTWFYFPQKYTRDVAAGGWASIMQWKSVTASQNDPLWILGWDNTGTGGAMRLRLEWWHTTLEGPELGQSGKRSWNSSINIPIGTWTKIEARYTKTSDFTGVVQVWQDGVQVFSLQNVKTNYVNGQLVWYTTNMAESISPSPYVIYADDIAIRAGP